MRTFYALFLLLPLANALSAQGWEEGPPMPTARASAASVVLDGRIYVIGGENTAGDLLAAVEVFTPGEGWATRAPLNQPRAAAAAAVYAGRVVVIGGRTANEEPTASAEVYNAEEDRWEPFEPLMTPREGLGAATIEETLYVIGGAGVGGTLLETAEVYTIVWESYTPPWSLTPARAQFGTARLGDAVVTVGGFSDVGPLRDVTAFDPLTGSVTTIDPLPFPRGGLAAASDNMTLYAIGGRDADDEVHASVVALEQGIGEGWELGRPLPVPVEAAVAAVVDDDLYVIGGADGFGSALASVYALPIASVATGEDAAPTTDRDALAVVGPNPSQAGTTFEIRTAREGTARLAVSDVLGREVAVLHDGPVPGGALRVAWTARVPAGVYVARLVGPSGTTSVAVTVAR